MSNEEETGGAKVYLEMHKCDEGESYIKALEVVADAPVSKKRMAELLKGLVLGLEA